MSVTSKLIHGSIESVSEEDSGTVIRTEHRFNPHKEEDRQEFMKAKKLPGRLIGFPLTVLLRNHLGEVREVYSTIEHSMHPSDIYLGGVYEYKTYKPGDQFP